MEAADDASPASFSVKLTVVAVKLNALMVRSARAGGGGGGGTGDGFGTELEPI